MEKDEIASEFRLLQDFICTELEALDGLAHFQEDMWERDGGGGGRTRIIRNGDLIEKGGVNFSEVEGKVSHEMKRSMDIDADSFYATGVSIVLHPDNPHVPIIHMNVRYFELSNGNSWFGGGIDLTPHYVIPDKAAEFHSELKKICDKYHSSFYSKFKDWADNYFYIPHRNETRGIGGIFFDQLKPGDPISKEGILHFCLELGRTFPFIYKAQAEDRRSLRVSERDKEWQSLRRGRYVEFNLVNDRGTKFGLVSGGRTESILMSMPPRANWEYCFEPEKNSDEEFTLHWLRLKHTYIHQ